MLLGIDLGTGSAKALLLATDGTAACEASSSYPVHAPHPGWAESEPADWWLAVGEAVRFCCEIYLRLSELWTANVV
jgi:sugar (pentulose or hexulose) kinase